MQVIEGNAALNTYQKTAADKALVWKQDLRIVPLAAGIYLLCYLDRSNIGMRAQVPSVNRDANVFLGNAKTLNSNTHDDLLSDTHMTSYQYT